jgi:hypothetical protein
MRDNRPSGSEGGVESHISIPTPISSSGLSRPIMPLLWSWVRAIGV